MTTLQEYEGKPLPIGVYSSKEQSFRGKMFNADAKKETAFLLLNL